MLMRCYRIIIKYVKNDCYFIVFYRMYLYHIILQISQNFVINGYSSRLIKTERIRFFIKKNPNNIMVTDTLYLT